MIMYKYMVMCKVLPKSGMDIIKANLAIKSVTNALDRMTTGTEPSSELSESLQTINSVDDGYLTETIPIDSDDIIKNPEIEVMPTIRESFPNATLEDCIYLGKVNSESSAEKTYMVY